MPKKGLHSVRRPSSTGKSGQTPEGGTAGRTLRASLRHSFVRAKERGDWWRTDGRDVPC